MDPAGERGRRSDRMDAYLTKEKQPLLQNTYEDGKGDIDAFDDELFQYKNFTYTGLLQGAFDDIYTPQSSNKTMKVVDKSAGQESSGLEWQDPHANAAAEKWAIEGHRNLTGTGSCSGPTNSEDAPNANRETNLEWTNGNIQNDDQWTDSLFKNIEHDEDDDGTETFHNGESTAMIKHAKQPPSNPETAQGDKTNDDENDRDLCEEDVELFLENEESNSQGQNDFSVDKEMIPEVGMEFKTREEAQNFFNMYAFATGFSIAIVSAYRTTSRKRNGEVIRATIKCNKFGRNTPLEEEQKETQRQSTVIDRTGCKVEMVISERGGVWRITNLLLDHNHALSPQSKFFRSHIYMSNEEKVMIRSLRQANITTSKIVSVLSFLRGGHEVTPYNKKKVSNYGTSVNRELKNSDVMQVVQFFKKKRAEDSGFYYSFQVDKNNKVRSVFWADAKSRSYYESCGDCISFDTTFLTNKYNLPFAPIVGVSTHGNTYLFACALLVNETAKTFKWVFREFLWAMGGKHPQTIITDQDKAMQIAIEEVFPKTIHRACLFHVKSSAENKLCPTFRANEGMYEEFQDIINNSLTEEEFETLWHKMVADYQVGHIDYFKTLWDSRKRYVPVYFKKHFFPFLQTTTRSEGTNSLFKRGVGAQYSMTSFLREYQRIMDSIHATERECDHNVIHKKVPPRKFETKYYIEVQAHELYNLPIFRKFQNILKDVTRLRLKEEKAGELYLVFQAQNYIIKEHRPRNYVVQVNLEREEYQCICCKFEKDGLVCSHILKVMLHIDIPRIPDKYFIDRWRKKHKREKPLPVPDKLADNDTLRYNMLARRMVKSASKGATHKRKYDYLLSEMDRVDEGLERIEKELQEEMKNEVLETRTMANFANTQTENDATSVMNLLDPDDAHTKGRPRMMNIREAIKANKFYTCSHCGEHSHTLKTCTNLHKEYNLPKPKAKRRRRTAKSGTQDSAAATQEKSAPAKRKTSAKKTQEAPDGTTQTQTAAAAAEKKNQQLKKRAMTKKTNAFQSQAIEQE